MASDDKVSPKFVDLLFDSEAFGKMYCVDYASGSGTNFRESVLESREPGSNFSIDLLVVDKLQKKKGGPYIGAVNYADQFGIPCMHVNGFEYCGSWAEAKKSVEGIREYERRAQIFNSELYNAVKQYEDNKGITFDLAVLAGYMRLFKGASMRRFNRKGLNIHPAALDIFNEDGTRKYIGDSAVFDALNSGEKLTRSSVILLDPETDAGAIIASGPWIEYRGPRPVTQEAADEHQNKQKEMSDWPALRFALREIARGKIGLHKKKFHADGNPVVIYDGTEMPYEGFRLG